MSDNHAASSAASAKPTEANNSAEREAQVDAITARVLRLRSQSNDGALLIEKRPGT